MSAVQQALDAALQQYRDRNPKSLALHQEAIKSLPGGNTRTLLHASPFPICLAKGDGYQLWDEDGHKYTDLNGEMSAGLYGHSHPTLLSTLTTTAQTVGMNLGGTTAAEARYAATLCRRFRLDRVRFCNSGTEAVLHALAAARRFTGRRQVVVFEGGYHGAVLSFGHGVAPNNVDPADWVVARYNDAERVGEVVRGARPAAVLVEGMQGSGGGIVGSREFLTAVQQAAKQAEAVFILDEIQTSRFGPHGIAELHGLQPDMKTLGKYLGGGLAFGAFGGREDVMAVYDPRSRTHMAHSGTFNQNTLAMAVGYKGLSEIYTSEVASAFTTRGDALLEHLNTVTKDSKLFFSGRSTILTAHFHDTVRGVHCIQDLEGESQDLKALLWMHLLQEGFWVTNRCSMAIILDTPESELERLVTCVARFVDVHKDLLYP